MTDRDVTQLSEHEKAVLAEREVRAGDPDDLVGDAADVGTTPYEAEVEAERRGTTAEEVAGEVREDETQPLDSGYQPRTG
jgi:hypothetical protein